MKTLFEEEKNHNFNYNFKDEVNKNSSNSEQKIKKGSLPFLKEDFSSKFVLVLCRVFLVIPFIIAMVFYFMPELISNYLIFTFSIFLTTCIFLFNFPNLLPSFHKHPIYVGDLEIRNIDEEAKVKLQFQKLFCILVNLLGSVLVTAYVDYFYFIYTTRKTFPKSYIEILATLGGLLEIVSTAQIMGGRLILSFCYFLKNYNDSKLSMRSMQGMSIELIKCQKNFLES
jgi:hypothetical protein